MWLLASAPPVTAQGVDAGGDIPRVVDSIRVLVQGTYVFPDTGRNMAALLGRRLREGAYRTLRGTDLAKVITEDLRSVYPDAHLDVRYDSAFAADLEAAAKDSIGARRQQREFFDRLAPNFGFLRVEVLEGGVGYLDLRIFHPAPEARAVAEAAVRLLASSRAVIIDLRKNGGGDSSMIRALASHLFTTRTHLNTYYSRPENRFGELWTSAPAGGPLLTHQPVYLLTSSRTFSAAEELAYDLQQLRRATIVGETTRGGAHPVVFKPVGGGFVAKIPFGRAINPITGKNWEGVGVVPDVPTPADAALDRALALANCRPASSESCAAAARSDPEGVPRRRGG